MMWKFLAITIFGVCLVIGHMTFASYNLPQVPTSADQLKIAEVVGFASAAKISTNPQPLGGYDGLQLLVSRDFVNVSTLKGVGTGGTQEDYWPLTRVGIGKGMYYDVDFFFEMTPPQNENFWAYSGMFRRRVYSWDWIHLGALLHGSISQVQNLFGSNIFGYDLYAYSQWKLFTFFVGGGQARGIHTFIGGASSLTGQTNNIQYDLLASHLWGGSSYAVGRWTVAGIYEKYYEPVYSVKLGYGF